MANKHLQLLRSQNSYDNRSAALTGLQAKLPSMKAGEPAVAFYKKGDGIVKMILGISVGDGTNYQIFDTESMPSDVQSKFDALMGGTPDAKYDTIKEIADALVKLNGADNVDGSVAKAVADALVEAKGYTDSQIQSLDVTDTAVEGSYVSAVSETDGKISVSRAELPTVSEIKSEGQAIIAVKEDKGVISATAGDIAAAHVTIADAGNHFTATTVEGALSELFTQAGDGSKVTLESAEGTDGVLKVYTIKQGGSEVGKINIPKDLVVSSGSVVKGNWAGGTFTEDVSGDGTALKLVIANQTSPVYINTLDLVKDHTAGNGINISDTNVVSVVVDPSSESFLTVGAGGVKLSGVANHVTSKIQELDANIDSTGGTFVKVNIVETDGKVVSATVTETDIASAQALSDEIDRAMAAEKVNSDAIAVLNGDSSTSGSVAKAVADLKTSLVGGASADYDTFKEVETAIKAVENAAISVVAGNGINITGDGTEKTIAAKIKANDPVLEVTADGIAVKEEAVYDCGTY